MIHKKFFILQLSTHFSICFCYIFIYCVFNLQKKRGVMMDNNKIIGEEIGVISIHIYKEPTTNTPFFYIKSENEEVLPISHIIEDTLKLY